MSYICLKVSKYSLSYLCNNHLERYDEDLKSNKADPASVLAPSCCQPVKQGCLLSEVEHSQGCLSEVENSQRCLSEVDNSEAGVSFRSRKF